MLTTSLQLERSFFTAIQVEADRKHMLGQGEVEVRTSQTFGQATQDGSRWAVELDLTVAGKPNSTPPPYHIHLHSVGNFTFAKTDLGQADKARLLAVTGVSILYSQAREYLLVLTARGPWGPFQLPTVSFVDARPAQETQAREATQLPNARHRAANQPTRRQTRRNPPRKPARSKDHTGE